MVSATYSPAEVTTMSLHKSRGLASPTIQKLQEISNEHGLCLTQPELEEYKEELDKAFTTAYARLDELPDEHLPVKYPRTPGYRPSPEENTHNAWYYKTDIKGADSGKLHGKRIAIKDCILVAGVPMINGCQLLEGFVPDEDATVVTRILDAGGNITGKANCENLCFSGSSNTCAAGPVYNPIDKTRTPGGSSCGSAVLVKLGEVDMALGGDQGGSIRIPSSWSGLVGLKPTYGLVPVTGAMTIEPSVDHIGPICKTVKDVALLLEVIAGFDEARDHRQPRGLTVHKYSELLTADISGKKVGILKEGFDGCEDDVVQVINAAMQKFRSCGATVEEVSIPEHKDAACIWTAVIMDGTYKTMMQNAGALQGVKGHQNIACAEYLRRGFMTNASVLPPSLKLVFLQGSYVTGQCGLKYVAKAHNLLPKVVKAYDNMLDKYDVLVMPTLPYKAPKLPSEDVPLKDKLNNYFGMVGNTCPFDITGHPAMSVNAGFSEGLPIGLQIVGKHFDEVTVLNMGYAFEQSM